MASNSGFNLSNVTPDILEYFVKMEIEPDTAYNQSCSVVVDRLCQFMMSNFPARLRPSEIVKSGSLGKGTAVKGRSDVDLVVFLVSYHSIEQLKSDMEGILQEMKTYLSRYGGCIARGTTRHAVKVAVPCHSGHEHEVDILPSVDILKKFPDKRVIFDQMRASPYLREFYSAALCPLQIEFVKQIPTKLKNLIRLIKYWRRTEFDEGLSTQRLPSSYILELITIGEWQGKCKRADFDLCKGFYNVLRVLQNNRNLKFHWTENYPADYVSRNSVSYVIDPANPFNNVLDNCNCWPQVAEKAGITLRRPLFQGISGSSWF